MAGKKSKISNVEWGLLIGALAVVDLVQIGLDLLFQSGVIINRLIDVFMAMALPFYLHIRGEEISNPKRLAGLVGTVVGEMIPEVDALPFWTIDGFYNMSLSKAEEELANLTGMGGQNSNVVSIEERQKQIDARRREKQEVDRERAA